MLGEHPTLRCTQLLFQWIGLNFAMIYAFFVLACERYICWSRRFSFRFSPGLSDNGKSVFHETSSTQQTRRTSTETWPIVTITPPASWSPTRMFRIRTLHPQASCLTDTRQMILNVSLELTYFGIWLQKIKSFRTYRGHKNITTWSKVTYNSLELFKVNKSIILIHTPPPDLEFRVY